MTTDDIVRALAAADPVVDDDRRGFECSLCDSVWVGALSTPRVRHEPDCPWQRAVEWVADQKADAQILVDDAIERASRQPHVLGSRDPIWPESQDGGSS